MFYCKRSQCFLKLSQWTDALNDAKTSIDLDLDMIDAYEVAAIAYENLNDILLIAEINDSEKNRIVLREQDLLDKYNYFGVFVRLIRK